MSSQERLPTVRRARDATAMGVAAGGDYNFNRTVPISADGRTFVGRGYLPGDPYDLGRIVTLPLGGTLETHRCLSMATTLLWANSNSCEAQPRFATGSACGYLPGDNDYKHSTLCFRGARAFHPPWLWHTRRSDRTRQSGAAPWRGCPADRPRVRHAASTAVRAANPQRLGYRGLGADALSTPSIGTCIQTGLCRLRLVTNHEIRAARQLRMGRARRTACPGPYSHLVAGRSRVRCAATSS